jgi:hypothetical protein
MDERKACEQLQRRFAQAGFAIVENVDFHQHGLRFDLDGFDAKAGVGYEYVTDEAGDGWDVDEDVIQKLTELRKRGTLYILVVDEAEAPDAASLDRAVDEFLAELKDRGITPAGAAAAPSSATPPPIPSGTKPPPLPKAAKAPKGARKKRG